MRNLVAVENQMPDKLCDFCKKKETQYFYDYLFFCEECWEQLTPLKKSREELLASLH